MENRICEVIVSYNSPQELSDSIRSALEQVDKIIVVDNGSSISLEEVAGNPDYSSKVLFLFNKSNQGLGRALNQGIEYSLSNNFEWTLLLDQDSILSPAMAQEMLSSYRRLSNADKAETAVIVPRVYDRSLRRELPAIVTTNLFNRKIRNAASDCFIHFQITSGSLIKNTAMRDIGVMNEDLFIDYIDFDFCFRALNKNYKILLCKNALLFHSLGEKARGLLGNFREHSPSRIYYQTRNRLYIVFTYGKKYRSILFCESCRMLLKLFKILLLESNRKTKIKMYFKGIRDFFKDFRKLTLI